MSVNLSPIGNDAPFVDSSGNPLNLGELYTYTAGSSTPQTTYTTSAGNVANANPIVLNSAGYPASGGSVVEVWLTAGVAYKFVLKNAAGTTLWTRDNIVGINDTSVAIDQWVAGPAPTYIGATSFSLVGDQTSTFHVGRRVKTTNTAGTVYSTISVSAFAAATTVTVVNDSGVLDSGLSAVAYALLSAVNPSVPGQYLTAASTAYVFSTGDVKLTLKTVADTGWVLMDDKTIGNGASGATGRANADTVALFTLLWTNTVDADCAVSTGRGGSAAADYAANKTIALPKALGRALATYGSGSGLTARALAKTVGVETHPLVTAELAAHTHTETFSSGAGGTTAIQQTVSLSATGINSAYETASTGTGTAHQNMQPTLFLNTMIKL